MFKYLIFLLWINKIYSLPGEYFQPSNGVSHKVNLEEYCPCDKTAEVCDLKCCCDEDCLYYMFDKEYYEKYSECDSLSSVNNRIDSRLDYCEGHKKSIDDLYNPLVLAFKILKKGFCLAKKNPKNQNNDKSETYNDLINEIEKSKNIYKAQENDFKEVVPDNLDQRDFNANNVDDFAKMNFNVPISLPNGLCLFNSYPIKKLMDYEVECSYHYSQNTNIINLFSKPHKSYLVENSLYALIEDSQNYYIKKVEIIYHIEYGNHTIVHYYENTQSDYKDFIFVVKFLLDNNDYIKSGNPGYIKGKPILICNKDSTKFEKYKNDFVFPIDPENDVIPPVKNPFFFNNYFDNKITFEDIIIYGYKQQNFAKNVMQNLLKENNNEFIYYGIFGNAKINYINDWNKLEDNTDSLSNRDNPYLLIGLYKDVGAVNNTQYQIIEFKRIKINEPFQEDENYYYLISKFIKVKTQKNWWYAKGPGFIKLPKNIMYPFRIGTTDYESKKR